VWGEWCRELEHSPPYNLIFAMWHDVEIWVGRLILWTIHILINFLYFICYYILNCSIRYLAWMRVNSEYLFSSLRLSSEPALWIPHNNNIKKLMHLCCIGDAVEWHVVHWYCRYLEPHTAWTQLRTTQEIVNNCPLNKKDVPALSTTGSTVDTSISICWEYS